MRRFSLIITAPTGSRIVRLLPEGEVTLGRNPICDIVLSEEQISRQHAKITVREGAVSLEDLGSNNGTFINGERLARQQTISSGDTVTIGSFKLAISEGEATDGKRALPPSNRTPSSPIPRPTKPPTAAGLGSVSSSNPALPNALTAIGISPPPPNPPPPAAAPVSVSPQTSEDLDGTEDEALNPWPATGAPALDPEDSSGPFEEEDQTVRLRASQVIADTAARRLEQLEVLEVGPPRAPVSAQAKNAEDIRRTEALARVAEAYVKRPDAAPKELIAALVQVLGADTAVILVGEGGAEAMKPQAIHHREPLDDGEVPISRAVIKEAVEQKTAIVTADIRGDDRFDVGASLFLYNVSSVMSVPLFSGEQVQGALYINRWRSGSFEPHDIAFAGALANIASLALGTGTRPAAPPRVAPVMSRQLGEKAARTVQSVEVGTFAGEEGTALLASLSELEPFIGRLGPQRAGEILCAWRDALSHAVFEAGGVLLSTDGLSARVVFRHQKNATEPASAVRAALACRRTFGEWLAERMPRIRVRPRFGVHTGRYVAGVWGAKETPEWVAVGEAVEGAFHLEQAAAPGEIIASPSTIAAIGKQFDLGPIDPARLAGTPEELAQSCAVFGSTAR